MRRQAALAIERLGTVGASLSDSTVVSVVIDEPAVLGEAGTAGVTLEGLVLGLGAPFLVGHADVMLDLLVGDERSPLGERQAAQGALVRLVVVRVLSAVLLVDVTHDIGL